MTGKVSSGILALLVFTSLSFSLPAVAVQPPGVDSGRPGGPGGRGGPPRRSTGSAERWVRQLENELDHLEEDLRYQRGRFPDGLREQIDRTSRAAAHFRQLLRRDTPYPQLMGNYREMDQQVHRLVERLEQANDPWLRRQASRLRYPDEQLHYVLQTMSPERGSPPDELLQRHARLLEREARNLQELMERGPRRNDRLRDAVEEFADAAQHFERTVARGGDRQHLRRDFREIDQTWREVVEQINRSPHGIFLRRSAQNVNRVHNQLHQLLNADRSRPPRAEPDRRPERPPQTAPPRQGRPAIQFEIPGIGSFSIPS